MILIKFKITENTKEPIYLNKVIFQCVKPLG